MPEISLNEKAISKALNRVGGRLATKARRAVRKGTDYDGASLPSGADGAPIDLRGDTGTLARSMKYTARLREIAPGGSHPTASKRAGGNYGLMQILMSGKGRNKEEVREPFDVFGTRQRIIEDGAHAMQAELDKLGDDVLTQAKT